MGEGSHIYGNKSANGVRLGTKRLMEKGDVNGDYSRAQAKVLTNEEGKIRNDIVENMRSVNAKGGIVASRKGGLHEVGMSIADRQNNVTTHNHPSDQFKNQNSIAARIGQSFSDADIANAIISNQAGTRVVTKGYTFNISRPKGGWGNINPTQVKATYTKAMRKFLQDNYKYLNRDDTAQDRAWTLANHKAVQAVAKKYGLKYTRKRN